MWRHQIQSWHLKKVSIVAQWYNVFSRQTQMGIDCIFSNMLSVIFKCTLTSTMSIRARKHHAQNSNLWPWQDCFALKSDTFSNCEEGFGAMDWQVSAPATPSYAHFIPSQPHHHHSHQYHHHHSENNNISRLIFIRGAFFAWRAPILSWPRIMCSQVHMLKFLEPSREMP